MILEVGQGSGGGWTADPALEAKAGPWQEEVEKRVERKQVWGFGIWQEQLVEVCSDWVVERLALRWRRSESR